MKSNLKGALALSFLAMIASLLGLVFGITRVVQEGENALTILGIALLGVGASGLVFLAVIRMIQKNRDKEKEAREEV